MGNSINKPGIHIIQIQTLKKLKVSDAEWKRFYPKMFMKYPVTQIPKDLYRKILGHR
jgi:hypothetical protein